VKIGAESKQHTGLSVPCSGAPDPARGTRERPQDVGALAVRRPDPPGERAFELVAYGERRRLEIARRSARAPKCFCWTNRGGDQPGRKDRASELIRKVNTELGVTVLLIEHDMKLVMSVAQRIVVLNFGQVIAEARRRDQRTRS